MANMATVITPVKKSKPSMLAQVAVLLARLEEELSLVEVSGLAGMV
jgi:hypothetical protein